MNAKCYKIQLKTEIVRNSLISAILATRDGQMVVQTQPTAKI